MIHCFIASDAPWAEHEPVLEYSIRKHATDGVIIHWMRPGEQGMKPCGCTGFTNYRYCVPELGRLAGAEFGIYLDVDMLVLGDIAELWSYRQPGAMVVLEDGSDEVAIFDCSLRFPSRLTIHEYTKTQLQQCAQSLRVPRIPLEWNVEDRVSLQMKLLHFTDLNAQPWFHNHPCPEAVQLLEKYEDETDKMAGPRQETETRRPLGEGSRQHPAAGP